MRLMCTYGRERPERPQCMNPCPCHPRQERIKVCSMRAKACSTSVRLDHSQPQLYVNLTVVPSTRPRSTIARRLRRPVTDPSGVQELSSYCCGGAHRGGGRPPRALGLGREDEACRCATQGTLSCKSFDL